MPRKVQTAESKLSEIAGLLDEGRRMRRDALSSLETAKSLLEEELKRVTDEISDLEQVVAQER